MARIVKDATFDTELVSVSLRLPIHDVTKLFPSKGDIIYDRPSEITGEDGILYYADGTKWIPLISSLGNNLLAGTGISITATGGNVTITNTSLASSVTLASAGGTESLVNVGSGPALAIKGLTAGTGITLTGSPTSVTIASDVTSQPVAVISTGALIGQPFDLFLTKDNSTGYVDASVIERAGSLLLTSAAPQIALQGAIPPGFLPATGPKFYFTQAQMTTEAGDMYSLVGSEVHTNGDIFIFRLQGLTPGPAIAGGLNFIAGGSFTAYDQDMRWLAA